MTQTQMIKRHLMKNYEKWLSKKYPDKPHLINSNVPKSVQEYIGYLEADEQELVKDLKRYGVHDAGCKGEMPKCHCRLSNKIYKHQSK